MMWKSRARRHTQGLRLITGALLVSLSGACADEGTEQTPSENNANNTSTNNTTPQPDPETGATDFVSADGQPGENSGNANRGQDNAGAAPEAGDAAGGGGAAEERTVEEGDIYRLLGDGRILNLNAYRGLQVIDFSDIANPKVIGRAEMSGHPVELYVVGNYAYVLLNNWSGYYGTRLQAAVEAVNGGLVVSVDLTDPTNPVVVDQKLVPGYIQTSRVARQGTKAALYVAASEWGNWDVPAETTESADGVASRGETYYARTTVKSFNLSAGAVQPKTELVLGGYVTDIQATPTRLIVARGNDNWWQNRRGSTIKLIDISSAEGVMEAGAEVEVKGQVFSQFNMDLHNNVLRIVSGSRWGGARANYIQTFNAADIQDLTPIDEESFGAGEDLYATLFRGNKAFFVTYFRTDPFHAFEITDEGDATEKSEFIVSGWNDFFRAVHNDDRLIGIGVNDEVGRKLAVSLYDVTDLSNPEPMIERREVEAQWSWSEANWDHRAFSVLEDAVSIMTTVTDAEGQEVEVEETGLVLLPFSGYSEEEGWSGYKSSVQIFTFSRDTLTARGVMNHPTSVRRSFLAEENTTGNLSETDLSFYDVVDPNQPEQLGTVELAPNYTDILVFGDHRVRVKDSRSWEYWGNADAMSRPKVLQVIPSSAHPDLAEAVASIEVDQNASVLRFDANHLVTIARGEIDANGTQGTTFTVYNLANAASPAAVGEMTTESLNNINQYGQNGGWEGGRPGVADCWGCGGYNQAPLPLVVGKALVFQDLAQQSEVLGSMETCYSYPISNGSCYGEDRPMEPRPGDDGTGSGDADAGNNQDDAQPETCTRVSGWRHCQSLDGATPVCQGQFERCTQTATDYSCEAYTPQARELSTDCNTQPVSRYWSQYKFHVVDLSNPAQPAMRPVIETPENDEGAGVVVDAQKLLYSYKRPYSLPNDDRPYVRFFVKSFDFAAPAQPVTGPEVNIPGQVVAAQGNVLFTQDTVYGERVVESAINRVKVNGNTATLEARRRFADRMLQSVNFDGAGRLLVTHGPSWYNYRENWTPEEYATRMAILDATAATFPVFSETIVDSWAQFQTAMTDKALFSVGSGILVINTSNPATPYAQAYLPTNGWPQSVVVDGTKLLIPSGRYGIYEFKANTHNLLTR